ncbi:MAG TPA: nucleoside hydrolase [Vicinamibacteria bacterium]|nr:nucleoside hydrolase [Vicinamibacteria bacterium]
MKRIILDCDPGQDDAVNILFALSASDRLELAGITTVAGNVPLEKTQRNARLMCELARRTDVAVYAGCPRPMLRPLVTAESVHGREGIDGADIHEPSLPLRDGHAVDFIVDTLRDAEDASMTLVPTGPLTNVATALVKAPEIAPKIREIVLMGGAMREGGNVTPSAEFNIFVDPHAAKIVFACGRPLVVMGLDVTHQALATPTRLDAIGRLGTSVGRSVKSMLEYFNRHDTEKYGTEGAPLHDPCTVAYLLEPALFRAKRVHIDVETVSDLTLGETVVDFWGVTALEPNALWVHTIDAGGFFELLTERLSGLP